MWHPAHNQGHRLDFRLPSLDLRTTGHMHMTGLRSSALAGAAVKRILRYVAGTKSWGVFYTAGKMKASPPCLLGFSDNDMAGDVDDRKSTGGMIYFLSDNPIAWQSSKQKVALSSCKTKYIAASAAACQGIWLAHLMAELLIKLMGRRC